MKREVYVSIVLVAVALGLLMAFQFRAASSTDKGVPYDRLQELTIEKKQLERDIEQLKEEAADLTDKLEEAGKGYEEAVLALEKELSKVRLYAGLVPVCGPGVEVILDNPPAGSAAKGVPLLSYVRDEDLLKVVNELRGAGAEAISVNGQRILATSEIRQAGGHINVNTVRLSPPYTVAAIGNPSKLKSSLEIKGGLVDYLSDLGIVVKVQERDEAVVPAYSGPLRFDYARPVEK